MSRYFNYTGEDYVAHFGIKGMKWGIRRYQKSNGSLTPSGKTRYDKKSDHQLKLEAKYQQKGKSKAEAEAAAKKRIEIEKTIAISDGIILGSVAAHALIKKYKGHSDNIIAEVKDKPYDSNGFIAGLISVVATSPFIAPVAVNVAEMAYAKNTKRSRARSMNQAGISDSDIAKQLNISEADVKKLTSNNKGYALASDHTHKHGGSKAFDMKKLR